ncbi:MAG: EAL domain-containing protein [Deinococcus-Thermus bacterium]|jgi:EAL domain-containing protein (putative c-di-GMP-specific phosphodiesterase class I)|nr:EAL domain-containing protein [Deinococcota bacterium]
MSCPICERPIAPATGPRDFHLWPPLGHTEGKVLAALRDLGHPAQKDPATEAIRLAVAGDDALGVLSAVADRLTPAERQATAVLDAEPGAPVDGRSIRAVASLDQTLALRGAGWLVRALEAERLPVALDRIAFADEPGETFAYHARAYSRGDDDTVIDLCGVLQTARRAGILFPVDRTCRLSAIARASELALSYPIFVPFSPASIYDPEYCLRTTVAEAERSGMPLDSLVFTILSPEPQDDPGHLQRILDHYRGNGFRVAMAGVGSGFTAFELLPLLRPDTLFLDRALIALAPGDPFFAVIARKLLEIAHRLDIETVVDGVADESQAEWAYENGANYVSGPFVADAHADLDAAA